MNFKHEAIDLGYTDMIAHTTEEGRVYEHPVQRKNYPSITTVLSILSEASIAKWRARVGEEEANRVSTRASRRGTAVHEALENFVDNEEWSSIKKKYTPDVISSVMGVKDILSERIGKVYGQELPLYSDHLRVAGRVDCVAEFDGVLSIIDFKTSRKTKRKSWCESYFCQEAAYAIMWEERTGMPITQLVTIITVDDNKPQVFIEHRDNWTVKLKDTIREYNKRRDQRTS
jgi:genome maintenance exonuclease 1